MIMSYTTAGRYVIPLSRSFCKGFTGWFWTSRSLYHFSAVYSSKLKFLPENVCHSHTVSGRTADGYYKRVVLLCSRSLASALVCYLTTPEFAMATYAVGNMGMNMQHWWNVTDRRTLKYSEENPVPVPLCTPQRGLAWGGTRASAVRGRRLIAFDSTLQVRQHFLQHRRQGEYMGTRYDQWPSALWLQEWRPWRRPSATGTTRSRRTIRCPQRAPPSLSPVARKPNSAGNCRAFWMLHTDCRTNASCCFWTRYRIIILCGSCHLSLSAASPPGMRVIGWLFFLIYLASVTATVSN